MARLSIVSDVARRLADCDRCTALKTAGTPGKLGEWGRHVLDDHRVEPQPRPGCRRCAHYDRPCGRIPADLWADWGRQHFVRHLLGIVDDGLSALRLAEDP